MIFFSFFPRKIELIDLARWILFAWYLSAAVRRSTALISLFRGAGGGGGGADGGLALDPLDNSEERTVIPHQRQIRHYFWSLPLPQPCLSPRYV